MGAKMKISFALIAGALSQSTNSSVEQGITELPLASDSLLSASNSSSISDLEFARKGPGERNAFITVTVAETRVIRKLVCAKGTSVSVRHITKVPDCIFSWLKSRIRAKM